MINKKQFEFDSKIMGKSPMEYMSSLLERNEKQAIDIERGKKLFGGEDASV